MNFDNYCDIFRALSHPVRLKIACGLVKKKECNVSTMVEKLGVSQPTVSQHLNTLKNAGVVEAQRKGTQICYKVTNSKIIKIIEAMEIEICE